MGDADACTKGYESCLADHLEYEEYYSVNEDGKAYNPYRIKLPQFNNRIAGYRQINKYFQNTYQNALQEKEDFFNMLGENDTETTLNWYQFMDYNYVYIGEKYITVAKYRGGYWGGIRSWTTQEPVTFDRTSGEVVTLENIFGRTTQEIAASVTGSVYKYMEGIGRGTFLLKDKDMLTEKYDPEKYFLFSDGIGIYYERYDIDCGAAGDYLFVVPWEEFKV